MLVFSQIKNEGLNQRMMGISFNTWFFILPAFTWPSGFSD